MRSIKIVALMLALCGMACAQAVAAERPTLKDKVEVAGDIVRIGDLIEHSGVFADIAAFRAPDLGHTGAVAAGAVLAVARKHGLGAVDTQGLSEVVVTRPGRLISAKEIERAIAAAIAGRLRAGVENLSLTFDREIAALHVEPQADGLRLARASYDAYSSRFDVTFELVDARHPRRRYLRYTGIATETVEIALLTRPVARGDVIRSDDVVVERRPKTTVVNGALTTVEQLIGKAARRQLPASQAVRAADLMRPELVRQNEPVTVVYQAPGLSLTMRGKALESGAEGDLVNVLNERTKRTMQGAVSAPGRVSVVNTIPQVVASEPARSVAAHSPQQRTE